MELTKIFQGRDFKNERKQISKEADSLISTSKVSQNARKGYSILEKAMDEGPNNLIEKLLADPTKVQMKQLNTYLN